MRCTHLERFNSFFLKIYKQLQYTFKKNGYINMSIFILRNIKLETQTYLQYQTKKHYKKYIYR